MMPGNPEAVSSIVQFWRRLDDCIHPDDEAVFAEFAERHSFNLDFPPPAFVGDVDRAPVLLLMANGGYHADKVAEEFAAPNASTDYRNRLHNPAPIGGSPLARYYGSRNYGRLLANGKLALVNAVAYRSPRLSKEQNNKKNYCAIFPPFACIGIGWSMKLYRKPQPEND